MKIIKRRIKMFEQFIKNPEDPNKEEKKDLKKKPIRKPVQEEDDEKESEDVEEGEEDIVDEMKKYFEGLKNNK